MHSEGPVHPKPDRNPFSKVEANDEVTDNIPLPQWPYAGARGLGLGGHEATVLGLVDEDVMVVLVGAGAPRMTGTRISGYRMASIGITVVDILLTNRDTAWLKYVVNML